MQKLIEAALPLSEINEKAIRERKGMSGHPANLHLWWGRSPVSSVQSALAASLIDAPESEEELLERLRRVQKGTIPELGQKPTVFDPFCGFGGIPLAAQSLGLNVVAGDLNPVAVMLTKAAAEIPAMFAGCGPVNPSAFQNSSFSTEGLAEDVVYYGNWLRQETQEKLKDLYPRQPEGIPLAWIWVRTVKCPNPACGCQMPLSSSYMLYARSGQEIWAEPVFQDGKISFEVKTGTCPEERKSNKIGRQSAVFRCPVCGSLTTDEYVKKMGQERQLGAQMMALVLDTEEGVRYFPPSPLQESAADVPLPEELPPGEIPNNPHWFTPPGFGFRNYSDLFSPRQLTLLTTLCDLLKEVQDKAASDALAAGLSESGGGLSQGGTGALAYGQAVSVYLAFVIDKIADANSTICSWRTTGGSLRSTFGRQAIPMVWTYAEGNPFSKITGNFSAALKNVADAIRNLSVGSQASVDQRDACTALCPEKVMVCTELPYYKAIGYAHLSDFFYIWMRKSLKLVYPELFNQMTTDKEELSTCGQYFGADAAECEAEYAGKLQTVLSNLSACADPSVPHLFFYECHKADLAALSAGTDSHTPWETLLDGLTQAGFGVTAIWPMRSSAPAENADGIRILVVCRVSCGREQTTRRGFVSALKRELPGILNKMLSCSVDAQDREIVGIGGGLSIFSRYKKVLNADGTAMQIHDALPLIYQEVAEYIAIKTADDGTPTGTLEEE